MKASANYIEGFNRGYIIRRNHPLLMKNLVKGATGKSQFLDGLKAGGKQFEKEVNLKMKKYKEQKIPHGKKKGQGMTL